MWRTFSIHTRNTTRQSYFPAFSFFVFFIFFFALAPHAYAGDVWNAITHPGDTIKSVASAAIDISADFALKIIANILEGLESVLNDLLWWLGRFISWAFDAATSSELYNHIDFITTLWTFLRDFVNSLFIIGVLFLAFKTALNYDNNPGGFFKSNQTTLTHMLIAAILINFSMFFVRVGIDASNVVTRGIYYRITTIDSQGNKSYGPVAGIISGLQLQTLKSTIGNVATADRVLVDIGGVALYLYVIFMFACLAFLLFGRMLFFIFIMAVSPVWFLGYAFGGISKGAGKAGGWANKMKGQYINQLTWPPMFVGITYIIIKYIGAMNTAGAVGSTSKNLTDAFLGNTGAFAFLINIGIIVAGLRFAVKTALESAREPGGMTSKLEGYLQKTTGFALAGTQGVARVGVSGTLSASSRFAQRRGLNRTSKLLGGAAERTKNLNINPLTADNRLSRSMGRLAGNAGVSAKGFASQGKILGAEYDTGTRKTFASHGGAIGTRSAETIKKEAEERLKKIKNMSNAEVAAVSGKKASLLDRSAGDVAQRGVSLVTGVDRGYLLGKQGKDARKIVVEQIIEKFKNDPLTARKILDEEFTNSKGENFFDSKDGKDEFGKSLKDFNKKVDSARARDEAKKVVAGAKNNTYKEAKTTTENLKPLVDAGQADDKQKESYAKAGAIVEAQRKAQEEAAKNFAKISDDDFKNLSADELLAFKNEITKNQIQMINKLLLDETKKAELKPEEIDKLNEVAKQIRIDNPNSPTAKLLANMAATGNTGFDQDKIKIISEIAKTNDEDAIKNFMNSMQSDEQRDIIFDDKARANMTAKTLAAMSPAALRGALQKQEGLSSPDIDTYFIEQQKKLDDLKKNIDSDEQAAITAQPDTTQHLGIQRDYARRRKQYDTALDIMAKAGYKGNRNASNNSQQNQTQNP